MPGSRRGDGDEGEAAMVTRTRTTIIVATLAGLTSLAGLTACGSTRSDRSIEAILPIAQTRSADAPPPAEGPGDLAGANASTPTSSPSVSPSASATGQVSGGSGGNAVPNPRPTVAKTQKWVKIFSGPSDQDIKPNADKTKGSHTVELNAVDNQQIGTFVTDGAGRTLYRFDNDTNKPGKSNCNGSCATAWPPLLIKSPGKIFPDGIDPKLIGYIERADHTCQVTINGWPVYYFIADSKPGDLNGQGVNGKWFAISPNGGKTKAIPGFPLKNN
jgi:predicted lipoprotein with Yx(FWY)xxD motif